MTNTQMRQFKICKTLFTTHEARISENFFFLLFFTSQISKRVDDDTKNEIENYDDDNEVEKQIIHDAEVEKRLLSNTSKKFNCLFVWCSTARQHRIGQFVPTAGG